MTQNDDDDDRDSPAGKRRKERVLHTRVPAILEQELKKMADSLRVPVSNVVRTILEDALDTVAEVGRRAEEELHGARERVVDRRRKMRSEDDEPEAPSSDADDVPSDVIAYVPIVLVESARCAVTGKLISAGQEARLGLRASSGVIVDAQAIPPSKKKESDHE